MNEETRLTVEAGSLCLQGSGGEARTHDPLINSPSNPVPPCPTLCFRGVCFTLEHVGTPGERNPWDEVVG